MKKTLFYFISALTLQVSAQSVADTVSLNAGYQNQAFYRLEDGNTTSHNKLDWDLAFSIGGFNTSIYTNSAAGINLWVYPNGTNASWNTVDTAGIGNWTPLYNSSESWNNGAFDQTIDTSDPFDVGWGIYNVSTHIITGDSLYIIELADGNFKKLDIVDLASGAFNIRFSNIDNSNEVVTSITKADYAGKKFGYYSILNEGVVDLEPLNTDWDLKFTQYTAFVPTAYNVAGILANDTWEIAQADGVIDPTSYVAHESASFVNSIEEIGYDWKTFNSGTFSYDIADDRVYFLRNIDGDVWKIVMTGFGGSANGDFIFTKEKLATAGLEDQENSISVIVYPNPSNGKDALNIKVSETGTYNCEICTTDGQLVKSVNFEANGGSSEEISTTEMSTGFYFINIQHDNSISTIKYIKK